jgi:hypothetical protein
MADNTGPLDINLDLSKTKTTVPMVAEGHLCEWRLENVGTKQTNEDKGKMVVFTWKLTQPAPNTEGGQIKPGEMGATLFDNVALFDKNTPKNEVPEWANKRIAQRIDALLGTGDEGNPKGKPTRPAFNAETVSQMIGKTVVAKMKVKGGDFPGNEFGTLTFPGDIAA